MKADAILMHRTRNVIALRAQTGENTVVQVLTLNVNHIFNMCIDI
jgi:hypothetical protein